MDYAAASPQGLCGAISEHISLLGAAVASAAASEEELLRLYLRRALVRLEAGVDDKAGAEMEVCSAEARELLAALLEADLPARLLAHLHALGFETRKDAMRLFDAVLRFGAQLGLEAEIVEYVRGQPQISRHLLEGCSQPRLVLNCGQMLRGCARYPELVTFLLEEARAAFALLDICRHESFDVACDAFASLRELLLAQPGAAARYMEAHAIEFFQAFNSLLVPMASSKGEGDMDSVDYVTQRQALRLLGEVLLSRNFMGAMLLYIGSDDFLRIHMNLLRDSSKPIRVGAFHVFKIFVAAPNKAPRVQQILHRNRERLIHVLEGFATPKEGDQGFLADLRAVEQILRTLEPAAQPSEAAAVERASTLDDALAAVH